MNIFLTEILREPLADPRVTGKLIIGTILNAIPILGGIFVVGYYLKRIKFVLEGNYELPEWEQFWDIFVMGLKAWVVSLTYLIIPLLLIGYPFISSFSIYGAPLTNTHAPPEFNLFMAIGVISIILVVLFIVPFAYVRLASTGNISDAFHVMLIISLVRTVMRDYILLLIYLIVLTAIIGILFVIPIIGWIITAFLGFYIDIAMASPFAKLYSEALQKEEGTFQWGFEGDDETRWRI